MSTDPDTTLGEDDEISVVLDRSKVHLFDTASGEAISHGLTASAAAPTVEAEEASSD